MHNSHNSVAAESMNTMEVAVTYRLRVSHFGMAAEFVGEAGSALPDGSFVNCAYCGKPETLKKTLICDGCEKSFHLRCLKLKEGYVTELDEWLCAPCGSMQDKHKWSLGRIALPEQVLPKLEGKDAATSIQFQKAGYGISKGNEHLGVTELKEGTPAAIESTTPSGGNQRDKSKRVKREREDDVEMITPKRSCSSNGLEDTRARSRSRVKSQSRLKKDKHVTKDNVEGQEAENTSMLEEQSSETSFSDARDVFDDDGDDDDDDHDDDMEATSKDLTAKKAAKDQLQKLKEFIGEKGGSIGDDWQVEIKKKAYSGKGFDCVFCSPDKQKFRSRLEVARFLGLVEQPKSDSNSRENLTPIQRGRKRKEASRTAKHGVLLEDTGHSDYEHSEEPKSKKAGSQHQDGVLDLENQLPLQCMDLKVEALGAMKLHPHHFDENNVWPVGYRCSWHDGVTGSICMSEVVDGGSLPPIFRVTRKSCHSSTTDLDTPEPDTLDNSKKQDAGETSELVFSSVCHDDDLLGTLTSFTDNDPSRHSLLHESYNSDVDFGKHQSGNQYEVGSGFTANGLDFHFGAEDEIGEIVVESTSSAGAWRLLAEKILSCLRELFSLGRLRLGCNHVEDPLLSVLGLNFPSGLGGLIQGEPNNVEILFSRLLEYMGQDRFGFDIPVIQKYFQANKTKIPAVRTLPPSGWPICEKASPQFIGDLLQIWEFLCRFSDILGMKEIPSLEELEEIVADTTELHINAAVDKKDTGTESINNVPHPVTNLGSKRISSNRSTSSGCCTITLANSIIALLKIAMSDLQQMASVGTPDAAADAKRGKKKEGENVVPTKKQTGSLLILNELTWPEVARRYLVGLLTLIISGENIDISVQDRRKILRCIQGDGGALCGALDGVMAIEADAMLLATAEKKLLNYLENSDQKCGSDDLKKDVVDEKPHDIPSGEIMGKPAWAFVLEPVRKLATNVGARIRNCVREALELNPPDWARETLEWSISKEVYKGNASGPTKRAVLSVLERVGTEKQVIVVPPKVEKKVEYVVPTPALVMKRCRIILRQLVTSEDVRVFCNSLGGTVLGYFENEEDNIDANLPLVTRPLDFRVIDSRLAAGAYGSSHESFAADMQQIFENIHIVFSDREDLLKVGHEMSKQFQCLYEEKVLKLVNGQEKVIDTSEPVSAESKDATTENLPVEAPMGTDDDLMKAPWEEGVCKICGVDKDDDSTLLCDRCDAEYHIYCLNPPLSMIPEGNWYCPSCVSIEQQDSGDNSVADPKKQNPQNQVYQSRLSEDKSFLSSLVRSMTGKDYWQLGGSERVQLLKFLCDKVLESVSIRDHIDQCSESLAELQQKLRLLMIEKQTVVNKGGPRIDEIFSVETTDIANKETQLPKKRGRKSLKTTTPVPLSDENSRSMNGMHDSNLQIDPSRILFENENITASQSSECLIGSPAGISDVKPQMIQIIQRMPDNNKADICLQPGTLDAPCYLQGTPEALNAPEGVSQQQNVGTERQECPVSVVELGHSAQHQTTTPSVVTPAGLKYDSRTDGLSLMCTPDVQSDHGQVPSTLFANGGNVSEISPILGVQIAPVPTAADLLEAEIEKLEAEIMKMAPRRECLGRDDLGRTYWCLGWGGKIPWLVVETTQISAANSNIHRHVSRGKRGETENLSRLAAQCNNGAAWYSYCGDEEIEQLIRWLKPTISSERSLKSALAKFSATWTRKLTREIEKQQIMKTKPIAFAAVSTKAATILAKNFGPISQPEVTNEPPVRKRGRKKKSLAEGRIFRCDCLELVWSTRIHCPFCHITYDKVEELPGHNNGTCSWTVPEDEGQATPLSKTKKVKNKGQEFNPPDLSLVIRKFTVHTSNRERILQIGLLGDKGPRFVPALPFSPLLDPVLHLAPSASPSGNLLSDITNLGKKTVTSIDSKAKNNSPAGNVTPQGTLHKDASDGPNTSVADLPIVVEKAKENKLDLTTFFPPSQSLDEKHMWAFNKLKTSLLDIECMLSVDMMEPSRSDPNRRRAWRSLVKSAVSILELVQCLVLLEQMIKAGCLKELWCNWTCLSASVGINTLSALALRIYTFDAAVKYKRSLIDSATDDNDKPSKSGKKKKVKD